MHFPVQRSQYGKEDDTQCQNNQLPARTDEGRKKWQKSWGAEHITVDLLPAGIFNLIMMKSFFFIIVTIFQVMDQSITCVVLLESPKKNQRHESHQEQDHHEGVEDGEPVDRMFEKVVIQVTVESGGEFLTGLFELDVQSKVQLCALFHLNKRFWVTGQVDLDNLIIVVRNDQVANRVNIGVKACNRSIIQICHVIQTIQIILFFDTKLVRLGKHFSDHSPDRQIVQIHLIEPTMLGSLLEVISMLLR
mmetsp:Transcript_117659/g.175741  ORF Transcript_117659/g.175741 Transcript_117659/m.175741 type:complete len:248 (-) Transcript_117659:371-1114(-)